MLVAVNYASIRSQCWVKVPFSELCGKSFRLRDLLGSDSYLREGSDLFQHGLYLDMPEWGYHAFTLTQVEPTCEVRGLALRHTLCGHEGLINLFPA